jgi:hypothetical protein
MEKLAIVGGGESTRDAAPYKDEEWDIWSVARRHNEEYLKRVTTLFEIHPRKSFECFYLEELQQLKVPVYMQKQWEDIPMSLEFPLLKVLEVQETDWFINTFSYLIPFAVILGYREIVIYGLDVEDNWEYQWDCLCYHARNARANGVSVTFYGLEKMETDIVYDEKMKEELPRFYGYDYVRYHDGAEMPVRTFAVEKVVVDRDLSAEIAVSKLEVKK